MPLITINVRDGAKIKPIELEIPKDMKLEVGETVGDFMVSYGHKNGKFDYTNVVSVGGLEATKDEIAAAKKEADKPNG